MNTDTNTAVLDNCLIIPNEQAMSNYEDYTDEFNAASINGTSLLFIAPMFSEAFIRFALTNKQRGCKVCLIKCPGYGKTVKENFKDIAAFTRGIAEKVVVTNNSTTIFNNPEKELINKRVKQLESLASDAIEIYDEKDYRERISRLNQASAIIYAGGITEKNVKEEFDRI